MIDIQDSIPYGTICIKESNTESIELSGSSSTIQLHWAQLSADNISLLLSTCPSNYHSLVEIIKDALKYGILHIEYASHPFHKCTILRVYFVPSNRPSSRHLRKDLDSYQLSHLSRRISFLLRHVSLSPTLWMGSSLEGCSYQHEGEPTPNFHECRCLADLFDLLPSPNLDSKNCTPQVQSLIHRVLEVSCPTGMRTPLYKYQKETIARMILQELQPSSSIDPLFLPLSNIITEETFYFQPSTLEITRSPPLMAHPSGGILSEELGSGKTCLILATRDQLPVPEDSPFETRPVLTPAYSPRSPPCDSPDYDFGLSLSPMPTLIDLILHKLRTQPESTGFREYQDKLEQLDLWSAVRFNTPFYLHGESSRFEDSIRKRRVNRIDRPRRIYLTAATLVLVPSHLLIQWNGEINKHCENSALKTIVIDAGQSIPCPMSLANDYDLIIMTHTRFADEAKRNNISMLHSVKQCNCPFIGTTRVPKWKRVIIDEGHVVANHTTGLTSLSKLLNVERRWMVSGTPTVNLQGLRLGYTQVELPVHDESLRETNDDLGHSMPLGDSMSPSDPLGLRWPVLDRQDLRKLASILIHFVQVPQFAAQPKLFDTMVCAPLLRPDGPGFGAVRILYQVMSQTMIRHSVADIEKEVKLPPLTQEVVALELDPFAIKTFNVLQCAIVINAVDSERTDQDYLFHSRNVASLLAIMTAMSQAMFWHADPKAFNVDKLLYNARSSLTRAVERRVSQEDIRLLTIAIKHIETAAQDELWHAIQQREDIPFRVSGLLPALSSKWSRFDVPISFFPNHERTTSSDCYDERNHITYLHPDRLLKLKRAIDICGPSLDLVLAYGYKVNEGDIEAEQQLLLNMRRRKRGKRSKDDHSLSETSHGKVAEAAHKAKGKIAQVQKREQDGPENINQPSPGFSVKDISTRELDEIRVGSSLSSKLTWILHEVPRYVTLEKFLIFSASPLTLAHVGDGLDVLGVPYLTFTSATARKSREQMPTTFETADSCRVFLMELKHGARGLNLITASRVIFCEPIWQADVESQAIKRVHRIGQTRPISVKTLVIRSTFEEVMMQNRNRSRRGREVKRPSLTEEPGMRAFLKNPTFLEGRGAPIRHEELFMLSDVGKGVSIPRKGDNEDTEDIFDHPNPYKRIRFEQDNGEEQQRQT